MEAFKNILFNVLIVVGLIAIILANLISPGCYATLNQWVKRL